MRYALTILALLGLAAPDSQAGGRLFRGRCRPCVPAACRPLPQYAPHAAPSPYSSLPFIGQPVFNGGFNKACPCGPRCDCSPQCDCGPGCGQPERIPAPQACPGGKCPAVVPFVKMLPGCANGRCR
jgi:hypothetical protein